MRALQEGTWWPIGPPFASICSSETGSQWKFVLGLTTTLGPLGIIIILEVEAQEREGLAPNETGFGRAKTLVQVSGAPSPSLWHYQGPLGPLPSFTLGWE